MEKNAADNVHKAADLDPAGDVGSGSDTDSAIGAHANDSALSADSVDPSVEVDSAYDGLDSSSDECEFDLAEVDRRYGVELTVFFFFLWSILCVHVHFQLPVFMLVCYRSVQGTNVTEV